ncbi:MAG: TMEM165/GDT1 family protein [Acidimicrobiales bacterium]
MDPLVALTVFAVIFPAELPDKTLLASLVLSTRFPPRPVWVGAAGAFAVHAAIAVAAGRALALLPHRAVEGVVCALFAAGAAWCWLTRAEEVAEDLGAAGTASSTARIVATAFVVVFLAEWGDITQVATANLAARYRDPLAVFVGALLALWAVAALAVTSGRSLLRLISVRTVRRVTGAVLGAFAVITFFALVTGS